MTNKHYELIKEATQWFNLAKENILNGKATAPPPDDLIINLLLHHSKHARLIIDIDLVNGRIRKTLVKNGEHINCV